MSSSESSLTSRSATETVNNVICSFLRRSVFHKTIPDDLRSFSPIAVVSGGNDVLVSMLPIDSWGKCEVVARPVKTTTSSMSMGKP